jgi:hypothetical protein
MACGCANKNKIRAAVEAKFRLQTGTSSSAADLIASIRQKHMAALKAKEDQRRESRRRMLTPDEVMRLSHGERI